MKTEPLANEIPRFKHDRRLVWHDEFEGDTLNPEKWRFCATMVNPDTDYRNTPEHARVENGQLHMQVHRQGDRFSNCEGIATCETMLFRYGYVEMRARLPYRHGAWPSFWMKGNTKYLTHEEGRNDWFPETDIFEVFSSPNSLGSNLHKWGPKGHFMIQGDENNPKRGYTFADATHLNDEYHIYALEWTPESMKFFVDDECYYTANIGPTTRFLSEEFPDLKGFHDPQYLILNNEIFTSGSDWRPEGAAITDDDVLPFDYYVDWVRLYQNPETDTLILGKDCV